MHWSSSVIFLIYESPSPFSHWRLVWDLATPTELSRWGISLHHRELVNTGYKEGKCPFSISPFFGETMDTVI